MKLLKLITVCILIAWGGSAAASDAVQKPVILINTFLVPAEQEAEAIAFWEMAAEFMKRQPGYISTALHKSVLPGARYRLINIAQWTSVEAFNKASQALRSSGAIKPVTGVVAHPALYTVIRSD